ATGGTVSVADLAADVGYSRQHLTRRFRSEFGPTPKLAARVIRLERARVALAASPGVSVAEVAAACGYADHAHLDRDCLALAGCTPTELVAGDVPLEAAG